MFTDANDEIGNIAVNEETELTLPVLPLRDVVVYPHMVIPLFVGRGKSIKALEAAITSSKQIVLSAQKEATEDDPSPEDIYTTGTLASVLQLLKLPDGTVKVLVEGLQRCRIKEYLQTEPYFIANIELIEVESLEERETEILFRSALSQFEKYIKLNKKLPPEILSSLTGIEEPGRLVDTVVAHLPLKISKKQRILEISDLKMRIEELMQLIDSEIDLLQVEGRLHSQVSRQMERNQREYYLNEKMKAIQKELGDLTDEGANEIEGLIKKIQKSGMTGEAKEKSLSEANKLKMMSPMSAEATVCRNYLDWMIAVPWKKRSKLRPHLQRAENILNAEHYGLEKVKEHILEYLAVQQRFVQQKVDKLNGPILCLVGPPGVGKTSLGQSIARATGREYIRLALGGVRDEAEIRGHRRTYIGAMPGKIVQKMAKVGVTNPMFLLDEIDKMAQDSRGDPASALLEVLDPEQNYAFNDHYLEVDYDLSKTMFVATANSLHIPAALLDRMEIIRLSGYTEDEKLNIAMRYLLPKQLKSNGLQDGELAIGEEVILELIRYYTRESGVRNLEREISKICRKVVKGLLLKGFSAPHQVSVDSLEPLLGVHRYRFGQAEVEDQVGQVTGLAWTQAGGDILTLEAITLSGKGKITSTGQLGSVMQESIQAAVTVARTRSKRWGIAPEFYEKHDIHIHVPEGATPKDGPSAGIGMCTALVSIITDIPVRRDVAMTGEITLRGQVLPIGGLKEKLLAARRAGILNVIIPQENMRDLREIPENVYQGLTIHPVRWIDEVLALALVRMPEPFSAAPTEVTPVEVIETPLELPSRPH